MLNMGAPANGSRPASQQAGPADSQRSAAVKNLSKQASRSFACVQQAPYTGILVTKTWSLEKSSDQRAAPADKLRIGSGAPHRAPLVMFPDGGRTHRGMSVRGTKEAASGSDEYHQRQAGRVQR